MHSKGRIFSLILAMNGLFSVDQTKSGNPELLAILELISQKGCTDV